MEDSLDFNMLISSLVNNLRVWISFLYQKTFRPALEVEITNVTNEKMSCYHLREWYCWSDIMEIRSTIISVSGTEAQYLELGHQATSVVR